MLKYWSTVAVAVVVVVMLLVGPLAKLFTFFLVASCFVYFIGVAVVVVVVAGVLCFCENNNNPNAFFSPKIDSKNNKHNT